MRFLTLVVGILSLISSSLFAQSLSQYAWTGEGGQTNIGLAFINSEIEYETESGDNFSLDRKVFGADVGFNMGDDLGIYGQFGRIISSEFVEFNDFDGEGFSYGFGAKTTAYRGEKGSIIPYAQFNYLTEELKYRVPSTTTDVVGDVSIYEFSVGSIFLLHSHKSFSPYAGFELYPLQKGQMKFKKDTGKLTSGDDTLEFKKNTEFKRSDVISMRFGASATFGNFSLRGDVAMLSETSFLFGTSFMF